MTGIAKTDQNYLLSLLFYVRNWFDGESNKPTDDILSLFTIDEFGKWQSRKERPHASSTLLSLFLSLTHAPKHTQTHTHCFRCYCPSSLPLLINTHKHKQASLPPISLSLSLSIATLLKYLLLGTHTHTLTHTRTHTHLPGSFVRVYCSFSFIHRSIGDNWQQNKNLSTSQKFCSIFFVFFNRFSKFIPQCSLPCH